MTDKQLEELDIHKICGNRDPHRYWCNTTESFMIIYPTVSVKGVLQMIYNEGVKDGFEDGKKQRSAEIMGLLSNKN